MTRFQRSSKDNVILNDARAYRTARLKMNNPKGWKHVFDTVLRAMTADVYHGIDAGSEVSQQAIIVLNRLTRLERVTCAECGSRVD